MQARRHIIRRAALLATTVATLLGAPGTAAAGGVDPTRLCIQDAANTYLYNPYSVKNAAAFVDRTYECAISFAAHMRDPTYRNAWYRCMHYGLERSVESTSYAPLTHAAWQCTSDWLQLTVRVDPYPN